MKFLPAIFLFAMLFVSFAYGADVPVDPAHALSIFDKIVSVLKNLDKYVDLLNSLLVAIIAISLVIPGDQPEKFLQSVVDFIAKFSKKPKA
jgi:hypothetical protein